MTPSPPGSMYVMEVVIDVVIDGQVVRYPERFICKDKITCEAKAADIVTRYARLLNCLVGLTVTAEYVVPKTIL